MKMNSMLLKLMLGVVLTAILPACTRTNVSGQQPQKAEKSTVITEELNGQTVSVGVGNEVVVQLAAQMGTGYSWHLTTRDSPVVVSRGEPELKPRPGQALGSAEDQLFHFMVQGAGNVTLHFDYAQPWEKSKPPAKSFEVTLQAK